MNPTKFTPILLMIVSITEPVGASSSVVCVFNKDWLIVTFTAWSFYLSVFAQGVEFPDIQHSFDVWHKAAKITKALIKVSEDRCCW